MADPIKISELNAGSAAGGTEKIPSVQGGLTVRLTPAQLTSGLSAATTGAQGAMSASDKAKLDGSTSSATGNTLMSRDSSGNTTLAELTANRVYISAAPSSATEAANKAYVDAAVTGLNVLAPCVAASTANVSLVGGAPSTVDGVSLSLNNRILVRAQTDNKQNGIYVVSVVGGGSSGTWVRSSDTDTGAELVTGSYTFVTGGSTNASTGWAMTTTGTIVLGSSAIVWTLFSQVTSVNTSSLIGQIVAAQVADAAITVAKFAAGLRPVEIVGTLPISDLTEGRMAYLTTDDKLYRYTGSSWVATVAAVDVTGTLSNSQIADLAAAKLTGQITTTQITDSAVTTVKVNAGAITTAKIAALAVTASEIAADAVTATKIFAGSVTTAKLAASAVTANELAANSVISGKIQAGAVNTTELAASAVTAAKIAAGVITASLIASNTILAGNIAAGTITGDRIASATITGGLIQAGTITADKLSVSSLSAITADIGSITAGTITFGSSSVTTSGFQFGSGGSHHAILGTDSGINESLYFYNSTPAIVAAIGSLSGADQRGFLTLKSANVLQSCSYRHDGFTSDGDITIKRNSGATLTCSSSYIYASDLNVTNNLTVGTNVNAGSAFTVDNIAALYSSGGSPHLKATGIDIAYSDGNKCNFMVDTRGSTDTMSDAIIIFANGQKCTINCKFG